MLDYMSRDHEFITTLATKMYIPLSCQPTSQNTVFFRMVRGFTNEFGGKCKARKK